VISLRRPSDAEVERYRVERLGAPPTRLPSADPPPGFHHDRTTRVIGHGRNQFERARRGLQQWAAQRGSGVEVFPSDAPVAAGSVVGLVTRKLGLWLLFACRVESVIDEPERFGFVYATLPGHPEDGYESFVVVLRGGDVVFEIDAVSRPGIALVRLAAPITRAIQRRATQAYLDALAAWIADDLPT
jgi:uncharacterized protein (UPF0548 family)